ncbi:unnamed protein product [Ixodes pacificus]
MGGGDHVQVEATSFRVADFSDILDWRPMLFQEPIVAHRACVLCGVVYRKAVRLPCLHTLCIKCHALCVEKGEECPVDQQPFCEDDVEHLEASLNYILKRKVACLNVPSGCSFVGPAASLLDHYKECDFNVVPCCLCHSSVLQSNILEHLKSDCSIRQATGEPTNTPATQDLEDVSRACLEMKTAIGKISEDLLSLQTSLNQCSEDVRVEGARCKAQLEAETSRLTEQLKDHSTVCIARITEAMQVVVREATADYKEHIHQGRQDFQLEWPFCKVFTVGFIHPEDQSKVISVRENPGECKDEDKVCFLRPKGQETYPYGAVTLSTTEKLEKDGFIESDTLHAFLEIEP